MTKRVELINKKKFAVVALNMDNKTFVVYVAAQNTEIPNVHPS